MSANHRRFVRGLYVGALSALVAGSTWLAPAAVHASPPRADNTILVWTDSTRYPAFQLYQQAHPNVHLHVVIRSGAVQSVLLFNRINSGWPDVVFDAQPSDVATLSHSPWNYTADLTPYVSKNVLNNFAHGTLAQCQINGKLYCLRNDVAENVLWYNAKLMKQFGYKVPTTWEQYQQLGLRVGKEHPGYIIGDFGSSFGLYEYLWASGCPVTQVVGSDKVRINMADPTCTRVAKLLDPLIANKTVSTLGEFDPAFVKLGNQDKILMMEAASWFGGFVFKASYKTPAGELAAALPLRWADEKTPWTGATGGGTYFVSTHAANPRLAADVVTWVATNDAYQATAPTQPDYLPAADAWAKKTAGSSYYAANPYPALRQASGDIRPSFDYVRYMAETPFVSDLVNGVAAGKTLTSLLPTFGADTAKLAGIAGYTVTR